MNPLFLSSVATTALKTVAEEPEAALSGAVARSVEASSGWLDAFTAWVDKIDGYVWGVPLIAAILVTGLLLTCVLRLNHLFNLSAVADSQSLDDNEVEHENEYLAMQEWRKKAKEIALRVMEEYK